MKERPILFSAPMVRALLSDTKTQTRRVVKPAPQTVRNHRSAAWDGDPAELMKLLTTAGRRCPYGQPGDRLWVRETFSGPWCMEAQDGIAAAPPSKWGESSQIWYWADGEPTHGDWTRPRPSIHMPRWASRITLEVTGVRVERLQDISEADAIAEGIERVTVKAGATVYPLGNRYSHDAVEAYSNLWEQINGPESWAANPWVWVVEFKRLEAASSTEAQAMRAAA